MPRTSPVQSYDGGTKSRGLTSPNRRADTTPPDHEPGTGSTGAPVRPSLSVRRRRRGEDDTLDGFVEDLEACIQPPMSIRCMNPTCPNTCAWPETRKGGRPSRFCHRRCQEKFGRARVRLVEELREISEALERGVPDRQVRLYLENQLARRRWLLARYPELAAVERSDRQ